MAIKFNPTYIDTIARAYAPNETVVASTAGVHKPFWALGIPFFFKTFLLIATQRKLLVVEHRRGLLLDRIESVDTVAWSEVSSAKVGGLLKKKLKMAFTTGREAISMALFGFLGPIARSAEGAKAVVGAWEQGKALPSTPAPALGAPAAMPQRYTA